MKEATIQGQHRATGNDSPRFGVRHVVCVALALMVTSAAVGAVAQRTVAAVRTTPGETVVHDHGGIDTPRPTSQCRPVAPRSRIVLVEFRVPGSPCGNHVVLVSDRTSARASL